MAKTLVGRRVCPDVRFLREIAGPTRSRLRVHNAATMRGVPRVVHHSPTGIEWGYGGSGPADAALSVLAYCLPVGCDGEEPVTLFEGQCSTLAWDMHQAFKWARIAKLPYEGGTLSGREVDAWIDENLAALDGADEEGAHDAKG